ncbi:unnamed protein product [Ambrosiozyma monospora]|uniref:Unnamed protein product n=1 Tax=Ambrosiozyma monospora TaxID=43982 RepID=A0ACB5TQP7_AMBMO|nr:unnamed protein product [Ambrosiozyma monospora]
MSFLDGEISPFKFNSPVQSPIRQNTPFDSPSSRASRMHRHSRYSLYSLQNNSNGSINLQQPPQPNHARANSATSQYRPGPILPPKTRSPIRSNGRGGSPIRAPPSINISRGASPIRSNSPSKYQPFRFGSIMMNNSTDNLALPGSNSGSITSIHGGGSGSGGGEASTPKASYRRGHRYKHSSVSMNMFQEPIKKAPKNVPKTYEVPKREQIAQSLSTSQKTKLCWAGFNMLLSFATYVLGFQYGNVCLSTLSHLIMYDSIGNFLVAGVQIMTNFEIWKNSSLKYPFGLGRIEVLAGFGLSVSLLFVGIELCSHLLEEHVVDLVVGIGHASEEVHSHHVHEHKGEQMNPILYELFLALVLFVTLYSSRVLLGGTSVSKGTIPEQPVAKKPYARRLSSLTLEEPKKTNINTHIKKYNILSTSTTVHFPTICFCVDYSFKHDQKTLEYFIVR